MESIYNLFNNKPDINFAGLTNSKIININNELDHILSNIGTNIGTNKLELPNLVVVGGQSSGKSTLLNNIITMNILPTGKEMVTRTPICIQLITSVKESIEFVKDDKYNLLNVVLEIDNLQKVKEEIEIRTNIIAGSSKGISIDKITIKILSKQVPNLTLIDLPGMTMVACTDKGQPKDIRVQIENMISEYIKSDKTIILAVIPARIDIEADVALGLIKQYDPDGQRTMGILTKIDLLSADTNMINYLNQNISKDLQLKYGYFLINNNNNDYFNNHTIYSKLNVDLGKRLGINNLRKMLTNILVEHIKKYLPIILSNVIDLTEFINSRLIELGPNIDDKKSLLHMLIADFSKKLIDILTENNKNINIGRRIKDIFINYKNNINKIEPFTEEKYPSQYIIDVIKNCEGNHMSSYLPPINVLEYCLKDVTIKPIQMLKEPSINCVDAVINEILNVIKQILKDDIFNRFPKLIVKINNCIMNDIIVPRKQGTINIINKLVLQEEAYIWSYDETFMNHWNNNANINDSINDSNIRTSLQLYYKTIIYNLQGTIPKCIMYNIVQDIINNLNSILFSQLGVIENESLLNESDEIISKRKMYIDYKNRLVEARNILEN